MHVKAVILENPTVTDVHEPKFDKKGNPVEEDVQPSTPAPQAQEIKVNQQLKPPGKRGRFSLANHISESKEETDSPPDITPRSAVSKASTAHTGETTETEPSPGGLLRRSPRKQK